jgi:hypothetical protein
MDWRWKVAAGTALELSLLPRVLQILSIAANDASSAIIAASIAANAMIAASMPKLHRKQFIIAV